MRRLLGCLLLAPILVVGGCTSSIDPNTAMAEARASLDKVDKELAIAATLKPGEAKNEALGDAKSHLDNATRLLAQLDKNQVPPARRDALLALIRDLADRTNQLKAQAAERLPPPTKKD